MQANQDQPDFEFGFASDVGRKRRGETNQDALGIFLPDLSQTWHPPLLLIADGLGGYEGGSTASQMVIQVFEQEFRKEQHPTNYAALLSKCVYEAHTAIRSYSNRDSSLSRMGSTVAAAVLDDPFIHALNVGDSRIYVVRGNALFQVSQDQSWVAAQVRAGVLTPQEAIHHPERNRLEMAITARRREIKPYLSETILDKEDVILLCTDGLWSVVPESLIWAAVSELRPQAAADKLVALANQSNSPDNVSVIVAKRADEDRGDTVENAEDTNA